MSARIDTKLILLLSLLIFAATARATVPANDNFANAQTIFGSSGGASIGTAEATREANEPIHALNRGGRSIWYRYTAPGNGVLTLRTTGSDYDTLLAVYTGTAFWNLKPIAAMDDFGVNLDDAIITIATQINVTYYIAIDGHNEEGAGAESGLSKLEWTFANVSQSDDFSTPHTLLDFPRGNRVESNVGASKQVGEPDHGGNPGGKSIWFRWVAPLGPPSSYSFSTVGSVLSNSNPYMRVSISIYTGSAVGALNEVIGWSSTSAMVTFFPTPGATYHIAVDGFDSGQGAETGTINLSWGPTDATKDADFDMDGKADLTVFRPTDGTWYTLNSITGTMRAVAWGTNGDKPLPGRADYDDRLDYNVFRPDTGTWWTLGTASQSAQLRWGAATDIPFLFHANNNYDIPGVFRPFDGTWYVNFNSNGFNFPFGREGDIPVVADYDGDNGDEFVLFRPSTGEWLFFNYFTGGYSTFHFGVNGDKPMPADYDGDGRADIAVYRPSEGNWYVRGSSAGNLIVQRFGLLTDKPQPGDYDDDGKADFAVYRPSNGTWYILRSSNGTARIVKFGLSGDRPIAFATTVE